MKDDVSKQSNEYEIVEFMMDKFKMASGIGQPKHKPPVRRYKHEMQKIDMDGFGGTWRQLVVVSVSDSKRTMKQLLVLETNNTVGIVLQKWQPVVEWIALKWHLIGGKAFAQWGSLIFVEKCLFQNDPNKTPRPKFPV